MTSYKQIQKVQERERERTEECSIPKSGTGALFRFKGVGYMYLYNVGFDFPIEFGSKKQNKLKNR